MLLSTSKGPLQSEIQMTWLSSQDIAVLTAKLPFFSDGKEMNVTVTVLVEEKANASRFLVLNHRRTM